jgi:signal transduction histidine kinase
LKISNKLFLYISILIVLLLAGFGYLSVQDERSHLMAETRLRAWTLSRTVGASLNFSHLERHRQQLQELVHVLSPHEASESLSLNVYDSRGDLLDISYEHGLARVPPSSSIDMMGLNGEGQEQILEQGGHRFLAVASPITDEGDQLQGVVEVILSLDHIKLNLAAITRKFIFFTLVTALLLGAVIYLISYWSIAMPVRKLKIASEKLGHGDLEFRIEKSGVAELDDLIEDFNRMAENLQHHNAENERYFADKLRLERSLRHSEKLASIGQLTTGLAHEIGTPLNVISGRAEHLLSTLPAENDSTDKIRTIIRQTERIAGTVQQLLAYSRKPSSEFESVNLVDIVQKAYSLCMLRRHKKGPEMELKLDLTAAEMSGDNDALLQLFVNLMLNSFQAAEDNIKVVVASRHDSSDGEQRILVTYEDNGHGVPQEDHDRVFDPFFTTKDIGEGTGLGLFIVSNIVREHDGHIELDPHFQGGARFIMHFPVAHSGQTAEQESRTSKDTAGIPS